VIVWLWVF